MYCKKCGKQIADDSVFCQFCGTAQDVNKKDTPAVETVTPADEMKDDNPSENKFSFGKLSEKQKVWLGIYVVWFFLNLSFVFIDRRSSADEKFFPFTSSYADDNFDLSYYDMSEFVVYAIVVPLVILLVYYLWKNHSTEIIAKLNGDIADDNSK
ncbi:MAG: zinc-ribbon domain-containing protein [Bacteroidales bacterium]|nr:zinc-ribbon domain-containing protein [Bacteroidales bacterium]